MTTELVETGDVHVLKENPLAWLGSGDPHSRYEEMRATTPVVWLEALGAWGVFRDAMVRQVFNGSDRFIASGGTGLPNYFREKQWKELGALESDPPDHTRLRSVLVRVLSPAALSRLKEELATRAGILVGRLIEAGSFDGAADFAKAYTLKVFLDAVGVAEEDREKILTFNDVIRKFRAAKSSEMTAEDQEVVQSFLHWEKGFCGRENMAPGSFGAQIYEAVEGGKINEIEGNRLVRTFISAGTGTTIAGLTQTLFYLASHPGEWAELQADPRKARAAFDETLRYDSPVQLIARCASDDMEWEGARIAQYDKVIAFIASANRDPSRWPEADSFSISRNTNGQLGLGHGIHGCVGQMLARMQAEALFAELAKQAGSLTVEGTPVRNTTGLRSFQSLPMSVSPARS